MAEITNWMGSASGTSAGTMTVKIIRDGTHMEGTLRLFEPGGGELQSRFEGAWANDDKLSATLKYFIGNSVESVTVPQTGTLEGTFDAKENVISGQWRTDVGIAGEFRWTQMVSQQSRPPSILVTIPTQFVGYWQRFTASTNRCLGKCTITWDKRYTKWLIVGLQLSLVGLVGYLLIAVVIDFLIGN